MLLLLISRKIFLEVRGVHRWSAHIYLFKSEWMRMRAVVSLCKSLKHPRRTEERACPRNQLQEAWKTHAIMCPPQWSPGASAQVNLLHNVRLAETAHFHKADSTDLKSPEWEINMLLLINVELRYS